MTTQRTTPAHRFAVLLLAGFGLVGAGCLSSVDTAMRTAADRVASRTGEGIGNAIGDRTEAMGASLVAAHFPDVWTPYLTSMYVNYLFSVAFHSGAYAVDTAPYEPGDWTRWRLSDGSDTPPALVERAFLARLDDGREWWRVSYEGAEEDERIILEGLFNADRSQLVRMRAQFPGEEPKELPVQEGTYTYVEPVALTAESLEGATVGTEAVSVPAGRFTARHLRYGDFGTTYEWWLDESVPGGMVKYLHHAGDADDDASGMNHWTAELDAHGTGATSRLGVL